MSSFQDNVQDHGDSCRKRKLHDGDGDERTYKKKRTSSPQKAQDFGAAQNGQ